MINYKKDFYVNLNYAAVCVGYEGGRKTLNKSTIIKVSLRDAVNELKLSPDLQTRSVMRYDCNYGESDRHLIYLVDDTIFDTYRSYEDRQYKHSVFRIKFETNSAEFIVEWKDGESHEECINGSFLYMSLDPNCSIDHKDAHFLAI